MPSKRGCAKAFSMAMKSREGKGQTKKNAPIQLQFDLGFIFNLGTHFSLRQSRSEALEQSEMRKKGFANNEMNREKHRRWGCGLSVQENTLKCYLFLYGMLCSDSTIEMLHPLSFKEGPASGLVRTEWFKHQVYRIKLRILRS